MGNKAAKSGTKKLDTKRRSQATELLKQFLSNDPRVKESAGFMIQFLEKDLLPIFLQVKKNPSDLEKAGIEPTALNKKVLDQLITDIESDLSSAG